MFSWLSYPYMLEKLGYNIVFFKNTAQFDLLKSM